MSSPRATGPSPYHRLDLTGITLPPAVLVGTHGRAAMLDAARAAGYPLRTVTPALTRFSRIYVIALGGDPDTGTVILGTADRREVAVKLPVDVRYRILPPTRVEHMLTAVLRDTEDADDGVTEDADVVMQERLTGGGFGEAFVGEVSPVVGKVSLRLVDHFADGGAGGGLVDEALGAGECGDEGL